MKQVSVLASGRQVQDTIKDIFILAHPDNN